MEPAQRDLETGRGLGGLILFLGACAPDWKNADLQLDVTDLPFADEDRISVCVAGVGLVESAAGTGLLAYPGIPPTFPRTVTVATDEGLGGSVEFSGVGYRSVAAGEQAIAACPGSRADEATGLLLAVRLLR